MNNSVSGSSSAFPSACEAFPEFPGNIFNSWSKSFAGYLESWLKYYNCRLLSPTLFKHPNGNVYFIDLKGGE